MRRRNGRLTGLACWLAVCAALAAVGCAEKTDLPRELIGTYRTSDERYTDRYFRLTPELVTIGVGDGKEHEFSVSAVYREVDAGETTYRVVYRTDYGKDSLSIQDLSDAAVVFPSQPAVRWVRGDQR